MHHVTPFTAGGVPRLLSIFHPKFSSDLLQIQDLFCLQSHQVCPLEGQALKIKSHANAQIRLQRWSFFCNDGMVMFFFQGTIAINGFSMVLPALDHHHWMFFYRSTIDIDGFPMVFPNSGAMVSDGFDLERDLKMRVIVSASIFNSSDQQVLSWYF